MNVQPIAELSPTERTALFDRSSGVEDAIQSAKEIIERVRTEGDVALRAYAREFDDCDVGNLEITDQTEAATERLDPTLLAEIETAAENIRAFHEKQRPQDWRETTEGRELGRRFRPIERVGVYTPGGTASYPSSALMGIIPAVVAGVEHVGVVTPPAEQLDDATLAAIQIAGGDAVYQVGGAQAIAALAYGTETVSRVEKIVGPGNQFVTAAKQLVQGDVEIDFLAGPSELVVVADETANAPFVAADLLAQAEHDPNASVVAVTHHEPTAERIAKETERQLEAIDRNDIAREALENDASGVFIARSRSEAVLFAESYAPEHLSIQTEDDEAILDRIDSAGSVFLGPYTPVAAGDYATGTNHVLPTSGGARTTGGLAVETFLRSTTVQRLNKTALEDLRETITTIATTEGLEAHARSVDQRFQP
ncbi:histidinol dehydrogenase [Halocatena halophila]|uniref:histidinol dehydrogenase n=1 Tax=Halocatena halophila TaxID=2814576 RepID=UPI002ED44AFD